MTIVYESVWLPLLPCFILAGLFVGSLYVWGSKHNRNHPSSIKQRFCSVFIVMLICPFALKFCIISEKFKKYTVPELLGMRTPGLLAASTLPLFLTMVLFLGPLSLYDYKTLFKLFLIPAFWSNTFKNLIWVRNIIVGPFSEEFTFRACMMPLLLQSYKPITAIFVCSLFFGVAHVHHIIEGRQAGEPMNNLLISAFVQFIFTTLFGAYSAFLFVQTGHFIAPFIVHSFCNAMGFPNFNEVFIYDPPKRYIIMFLFFAGVVLWSNFLVPLTNPTLYNNYIYYNVRG